MVKWTHYRAMWGVLIVVIDCLKLRYFFDERQLRGWIKGPEMTFGRERHSCARIKVDDTPNSSFGVIVVGGWNWMWMISTLILREEMLKWDNGPDLPFGIIDTVLLEDLLGVYFTAIMAQSPKEYVW
jgi:hypothetical protein